MTNISNLPALLLPGLNAVFGTYKDSPAEWKEIFEQHTSDMNYERDVEMKMTGFAQARPEGATTAFDDLGQRYVYTYRHVGVALGFVFTKIAIRDNLYKQSFGPNSRSLKHSMGQTKEVFGAAVLNNAMDTTGAYYGGDNKPLLSPTHPLDAGYVANTPVVQVELNETSLQDGIVAISRFKDQAGLFANTAARKLVVAPENSFVVERLLKTQNRVGTADNDLNAIKAMGAVPGGYAVNRFLTNTRSWYLLSDCPEGLKYFQRDPLEIDMWVENHTDNLFTKAYERYSFGWSNVRSLYGCMP